VVPNIKKYSRPFLLSAFWKPANAFPVLKLSTNGYLVRRNGMDPMVSVGDEALIAELSNFRARMLLG
jgi:hypothetical protein